MQALQGSLNIYKFVNTNTPSDILMQTEQYLRVRRRDRQVQPQASQMLDSVLVRMVRSPVEHKQSFLLESWICCAEPFDELCHEEAERPMI